MGKRPRLLLLDANAVFAAFRHGVWEGLCTAYEVVVPSTVARHEAIFYVARETGKRVELDLASEARSGRISEITVSPAEIAALLSRFDLSFRKQVDAGEAEALAYLVARDDDEMRFAARTHPRWRRSPCWASRSARCALPRHCGFAASSSRFRASTAPPSSVSTSRPGGNAS